MSFDETVILTFLNLFLFMINLFCLNLDLEFTKNYRGIFEWTLIVIQILITIFSCAFVIYFIVLLYSFN